MTGMKRFVLLGAPLATLATFLGGCHSGYTYRSLPVTVVDAGSRQPIPGAYVRVGYFGYGVSKDVQPPSVSEATTDKAGQTHVSVAEFYPLETTLEVRAKGYALVRLSEKRGQFQPHDGTLVVPLQREGR